MLKLYQRETCPYCKKVRELLTELQITYINVNVPKVREERADLITQTGKHFIPALIDDDTILAGQLEQNEHILTYLQNKYQRE